MKRQLALSALVSLVGGVAVAQSPATVSPGRLDGVAMVSGRCPTFHWTASPGADSVQILVYRIPDEGSQGPLQRVLAVSLPGSAQGWSPSLGECFEPGRRYAWSISASSGGVEGEWSAARVFEVSRAPSMTEIGEALDLLRRYTGEAPSEMTTESPQAVHGRPLGTPRSLEAGGPPASSTAPGRTEQVDPAPMLGPASLTVDSQVHLASASAIFKDGKPFLWSDDGGITALGSEALMSAVTAGRSTAIGHRALRNLEGDVIFQGYNTAVGSDALYATTSGRANVAIGVDAMRNASGINNVAVGVDTLADGGGVDNVAVGGRALKSTLGRRNVGLGVDALYSNLEGSRNTALGTEALLDNTSGSENVAAGESALRSNTLGARNVAFGSKALFNSTTAFANTAVGYFSLFESIGSRNIAVGYFAGFRSTTGDDNIFVGHPGVAGDSGRIRLGYGPVHTATYVAGIVGRAVDPNTAVSVRVDASGKLGTTRSSRRYKKEIRDMGEVSRRLLDLRPVTFRYREETVSERRRRQFGLIAEEVAEVFPELVVFADGRPETVKYELLVSLLLNEMQRLDRRVQELEGRRRGPRTSVRGVHR